MNQYQKHIYLQRRKADTDLLEAKADIARSSIQAECVVNEIKRDVQRVDGLINQAPAIIHDIHTQFRNATKLNEIDLAFLFTAVAIQTARWALLPAMELSFSTIPNSDRMSAVDGAKIEVDGIRKTLLEHGINPDDILNHEYIREYTWDKLLIAPVPYDAMHGSQNIFIPGIKDIGKELYSMNHHTATWGHDPVFGWILGPLNITARMITFRDFQTYHVIQSGNTFNQFITTQSDCASMVVKAVESWSHDGKRLCASVIKQKLHMDSDKYCKTGLPIPFLDAQTAQKLLLNGWNSNEVERLFSVCFRNLGIVGAQYGLSLIIDQIVRALHLLCYDEARDGSISSYQLKTQKIVCYSSALAELANGIYIAYTRDIGKMDIGGYLHFAGELMKNRTLQNKLEAEFLERELYRKMYGEDYYWEV